MNNEYKSYIPCECRALVFRIRHNNYRRLNTSHSDLYYFYWEHSRHPTPCGHSGMNLGIPKPDIHVFPVKVWRKPVKTFQMWFPVPLLGSAIKLSVSLYHPDLLCNSVCRSDRKDLFKKRHSILSVNLLLLLCT
jgi:hypothetical protein